MKTVIFGACALVALTSSARCQQFTVRPVHHDSTTAPRVLEAAPKSILKPAAAIAGTAPATASPKAVAKSPTVQPVAARAATDQPVAHTAVPTSPPVAKAAIERASDAPPQRAEIAPGKLRTAPLPTDSVRQHTLTIAATVASHVESPADESRAQRASPVPAEAPVAAVPSKPIPKDSAPTAPVVPARTSAPASAPAASAQQAAMQLNLGSVTFSGILQMFYMAGSSDVVNTFKLRRAELKFVGTMSSTVRWQVMLDLAKQLKLAGSTPNQSTIPLQDAFIVVKTGRVEIQAGQFMLPLTYEGGGLSSSLIEPAERSLMITDGKLGQVRDLGVQASTQVVPAVKLRAGVFNSTGDLQNTTATTGAKSIIARIEARTPIDGLTLGSSGAASGRDANGNPWHDRIGGDVEYAHKKFGARTEFMRAWDGTDVRLGTYALVTYRIGDVVAIGRYDYWDKDFRATPKGADVLERATTGGFAWNMEGNNVVLRANYVWRNLSPLPHRDLVIVALQAAW